MICCDEGKTAVVGMGYKVLSEWATLTYSILMEFKENNNFKKYGIKLEDLESNGKVRKQRRIK